MVLQICLWWFTALLYKWTELRKFLPAIIFLLLYYAIIIFFLLLLLFYLFLSLRFQFLARVWTLFPLLITLTIFRLRKTLNLSFAVLVLNLNLNLNIIQSTKSWGTSRKLKVLKLTSPIRPTLSVMIVMCLNVLILFSPVGFLPRVNLPP